MIEAFDAFLNVYGLAAIFLVMLLKGIGVPIPLPADLIMLAVAARVAQGKLPLWPALGLILLAMVLGGLIEFWLARGPGRGLLYRHGRYLRLPPERLDRAATTLQRGGIFGIAAATVTPGVRGVTVVGCGLAGTPVPRVLPGLTLGSAALLGIHTALGFGGALLLARLAGSLALPW